MSTNESMKISEAIAVLPTEPNETIIAPQPPVGTFRDPAFMENRIAPVHRWVPWIAGFSAQFVEDVFREFLPPRNGKAPLILDPFAGVGTTLVQALLHGFDTVGFEINPYAALACRTKLSAATLSLKKLDDLIDQIEQAPFSWNGDAPPKTYLPKGFKSRIPFFSRRIEPQILRLLHLINTVPDQDIANVGRIAFGSVIVKVSNYTYEPSLGTRPGAGKPLIEDANVSAVLVNKLRQIREDVQWLQEKVAPKGAPPTWKVHNADFLAAKTRMRPGSVDLMVTSPPYMNNYHYIRNTRPQMFWLSLVTDSKDLKKLEQANFGKYWQTVRDVAPIELKRKHADLDNAIKTLRKTRVDAGAYGGPGWANYVATYFNDCDRFLGVLAKALKPKGVGVIVIGNSVIQGIHIATDKVLGDFAANHGLILEKIIPLRTKRVGNSIVNSSVRRGDKGTAKLYETAVVVRKPT